MSGKTHNNIYFHLQEEPLVSANDLNKFIFFIVQSLPPLSMNTAYYLHSANFPIILLSDAEAKLKTLKSAAAVH